MTRPSRPVLRWHGGKWKLAPWIISFFPSHRVYVEPFGGAASVLLRKERAYAEVYNDLDDDVVNLFRVLQNPEQGGALVRLLELTPFARTEFELGWDETDDHVEKARRLIIRAFMGFGSNAHSDKGRGHKTTGFRANSSRSGTTPAHDWESYPAALPAVIERFRGVAIERRPAHQVMSAHDWADTLHYVDPPYLPLGQGEEGDVAQARRHRCADRGDARRTTLKVHEGGKKPAKPRAARRSRRPRSRSRSMAMDRRPETDRPARR
jgi:DNA adenine methylase